jgi:hypothetical protein
MSSDRIWQLIAGTLLAAVLFVSGAVFTMYDNQQSLMSWKNKEFPLEKKLLLVEHERIEVKLELINQEIDRIKNDLRSMRDVKHL